MALERTTKRNLTHWNGIALPGGAFSVRASSMQRGSIIIASGNATNTGAVSSVTTTRAHLDGTYRTNNQSLDCGVTVNLDSATQITASNQNAPAAEMTAVYELEEYV